MRKQYGAHVDAANLDLSGADPEAFHIWGAQNLDGVTRDPEDAVIQRDFWLRRIGQSRARLADVFEAFIMPEKFSYQTDPTSFIESKLPVHDLNRLYIELPDDGPLTATQRRSLRRLKKFLEGGYKNGVPTIVDESDD